MTSGRKAQAKLNLALHVTGQRDDGYHTLHSLVAFANFGDDLRVQPSNHDSLSVRGPFAAGVPPLEQNILGKALAMVRGWGEDDLASGPVAIELTKNLPVASGIGGGSADAAALIALLTTDRALSPSQTADILTLGADVPMCLAGRPAIVSGIGETIMPVDLPRCALVLVNPGLAVETPSVFRALTSKANSALPDWTEAVSYDQLIAYLKTTRNDLMTPAVSIVPIIETCLSALSAAPFTRMSGSGATCFALLQTLEEAKKLAAETQNAHPDWWVRAAYLSA
jgi:4-diphosphocytidyl-2-C-methyl-D-erythritol kinase